MILRKPDGMPWSRSQLSDAWTKERDTNPALAELAGCTLHGLRSTAIVRLRRAGVTTGLISSLVGLSEAMVNRYCRFAVQTRQRRRGGDPARRNGAGTPEGEAAMKAVPYMHNPLILLQPTFSK